MSMLVLKMFNIGITRTHIGTDNDPEKFNVWAGILGDPITIQFFIESSLTGTLTLTCCEIFIEPAIFRRVENNREEFYKKSNFPTGRRPSAFFPRSEKLL